MNEIKDLLNSLLKNRDNALIDQKLKERERSKINDKITFIKKTTPLIYHDASILDLNEKVKDFMLSDKTFCWICGGYGTGKTHSIYAIRNNHIMNGNYYFEIIQENQLNYDTNFYKINAIDNVTVSETKLKFLSQLWFDIIDFHWKNKKKLYITTTQKLNTWLQALNKYCSENAGSIASRLSNQIDVIELIGNDRRRDK